MNYAVDIKSLHRNFPEDCEVPSLLLDFGGWLKATRAGSVGDFCLQSERFNDFWIENGADLHPYFAFFLRNPAGGQIGYWLYDARATISPPIVLVGSEGELRIVSDSLEAFLTRLAEGSTKVPDLDSREQDSDESVELANWLDSRNLTKSIHLSEITRTSTDGWISGANSNVIGETGTNFTSELQTDFASSLNRTLSHGRLPTSMCCWQARSSKCGTDPLARSRCLKTK